MEHTLGLYRLRNEEHIRFPGDGESWLNISDYKYSATRMGNPPTISATIEWKDCLDKLWGKDVFVQFRGEKYFVNGIPSSSYNNTKSTYSHSVEFISERSILSRVYFLDVIQVPNPDNATEDATISDSSDFSFSGNISDLADRINIALNYAGIGSDSGYNVVVDQDVILEDKLFAASNQTIAEILNSANEIYNIPYYFVGKTIHFGYYQDILPTSLEYGANKSLLSISKNSSNNDIITKITGFGSDRNVPYYYPNPTPKGFVSMVYNTDFSQSIDIYPEIVNFYKFWNFFEFGEYLTYNTRIYKSYVPLMYHRGSSVPNYSGFSEWYSPDGIEVDSSYLWSFQVPVENITTDEKKFVLDITVYDAPTNTVYTNYRIERAAFYSQELERGEYFTIESNRKIVYDFGTDVVSKEMYDTYLTIKFNSPGTYRVLVSKRIEPAWESNIKSGMYQPEDFGVHFHSGPYNDDTMSMKLDYRINTQSRLMPSIYRDTNGRSRWIYAYGSEYENEHSSNHPMEYIHTDDEIFPSIKEMTNSTGQRIDIFSEIAFDETDNNEVYPEGHKYAGKYKHPYFFAKLRKLDGDSGFNLFQHAIEGQPMTISFTSGHTASCEFKIAVDESSMRNTVQVDEDGKLKRDSAGDVLCNRGEQPRYGFIDRQQDTSKYEVWIALEKEDSTMGVMMPDTMSNIVPTNEDTFVILGIHLPEAYFLAAERRLDDALKKYMLENNSYKFTYSAKLSSIFLKENPEICDILNENTKVPLIYNGEEVEWLMVESYNYTVKSDTYLPEISITLNDNIKVAMSKSTATSKAVSAANANASKSQAMAASARNQSSSTAAKTQSIERRVESLEQNSNNITVEKLKTQVSANSSDIYKLEERLITIEGDDNGKSMRAVAWEVLGDVNIEGDLSAFIEQINNNTAKIDTLVGSDKNTSVRDIANDAISKKTTTLEDAATSQDDDGLVMAEDAIAYFGGKITDAISKEVTRADKAYATKDAVDDAVVRIEGEIADIEANMSSLEDDIKDVENTLGTLNTTITQVSTKADNAVSQAESATTKAEEAKTTATEAKTTVNSVSAQMSGVLTQVQNNTTQIGIIAKDYLRKDQAADFATDLTGVVEATAEEFVYRPSAGEKSIRDKSAVIRRIKGNSVVWEQKLKSPSDENANWQGYSSSMLTTEIQGREMRCTLTGASVATNPYQVGITGILPFGSVGGHKYLFCGWVKVSYLNSSLGNTFAFEHDWNTWTLYPAISEVDKWIFISRIWESPQNNNRTSTIRPPWSFTSANGAQAGDWYAIKDAMFFDLTAMFGEGNEPATVEEFRTIYNEAYYPYCQPELRGVKTGAIKTVGFNLFDGECARVIGGMSYIVSNYTLAFYSETKNGAQTAVLIKDGVYTPECSGYLHLTGTADATPCVHFQHSGVMDDKCAPYVEYTLNLPEILKLFPINGMHGLRNTYHDVYDEINIDNYIKRLEIVDLGSLWWNSDSSRQCFHAPLNTHKVRGIALCTRYTCSTLGGISDKQLSTHDYYGSDRIFIKDADFDNPTDFMESLKGVYLVYELNEPIITPLGEPITLDYYCEDWGSEEAIPASSASAPFRADIVYQFNAEGRIRDNSRNIDKLEKIVTPLKNIPSNATLATQDFVYAHIPTRVATATERIKMYEGQSQLLKLSPNVMYDWTGGGSLLESITIPPLYINTETIGTYDHKWMVRVGSDTSDKVTIPFDVLWKDGIAPNWASWCICEITFKCDAQQDEAMRKIIGEWKIYK